MPAIGRIGLSKLTPEHVQQLINALLVKAKRTARKKSGAGDDDAAQETLSPRTVKHCRDTLRAALNVAMEWNLIARNPAASITVKQTRRRPTIYDEKHAAAFIEAIYGERLEALYWLALCLGPREGEILGLKWTDFDFEAGKVQLLPSLQRVKRPRREEEPFSAGRYQNKGQRSIDMVTSDRDRESAGASAPSAGIAGDRWLRMD